MFICTRPQKLGIFFVSALCFSLVNLPIPGFHGSKEFLVLCFLLSEVRYFSQHKSLLKKTLLWRLMIVMCLATVILLLFSPHYRSLHGFFLLLKYELLTKYFVIAYSFIALQKEKDVHIIYRYSLIGLSVLTFISLLNYLMGHSEFVNAMTAGRDSFTAMDKIGQDLGERYSNQDRFRVQGMFLLAFDYGYVCSIFFLFYLYGLLCRFIPRNVGVYALLCCLFGVITCNCRTVLFCLLISFFVYYYYSYGIKIIKYVIVLLSGFLIVYAFNSDLQKKTNEKVVSIFVDEGDVQGSSLAMRAVQYAAVFTHVEGHEIVGRGKDYFNIDMGWKDGREFLEDPDLEGIEGVLLNLILERGIIGVLFWAFFYFGLFVYIQKNRQFDEKSASCGLACVVYYLIYANMTGEMGCVYPTMLILGVIVKKQYLSKLKFLSKTS